MQKSYLPRSIHNELISATGNKVRASVIYTIKTVNVMFYVTVLAHKLSGEPSVDSFLHATDLDVQNGEHFVTVLVAWGATGKGFSEK
jgi:hypothetical protein